nr:MAG TPA: hypothetical protein [Caudoviricetes sp.]
MAGRLTQRRTSPAPYRFRPLCSMCSADGTQKPVTALCTCSSKAGHHSPITRRETTSSGRWRALS